MAKSNAQTKSIPKGFYPIEGICPDSQSEVTFLLPISMMLSLQRQGPEWKFYDGMMIKELMASPAVIFEGLEREELSNGLCYCGIPSTRYKATASGKGTIEIPFPPNSVFLVYVTNNNGWLTIFDWGIRDADQTYTDRPLQWQEDFGTPKWIAP